MNNDIDERRSPLLWCATCRDRRGLFVYMQSGRQYCQPCAYQVRSIMGLLSAGRRSDDLVLK
ncbi:MAG: hypothetical protein O3A76_05630 [Chloroflexi bacterium]|nr:hypothetical protein [Chloroflexota bacterium]